MYQQLPDHMQLTAKQRVRYVHPALPLSQLLNWLPDLAEAAQTSSARCAQASRAAWENDAPELLAAHGLPMCASPLYGAVVLVQICTFIQARASNSEILRFSASATGMCTSSCPCRRHPRTPAGRRSCKTRPCALVRA